jgi:transposase
MLNLTSNLKIFLATGHTDMRNGIHGLSVLAQDHLLQKPSDGALFVFRGKSADKIKILWFDGQGFCLFYKCLERGKFTWPACGSKTSIGVTGAQLSMLLEGIDWRNPKWLDAPERVA